MHVSMPHRACECDALQQDDAEVGRQRLENQRFRLRPRKRLYFFWQFCWGAACGA